MSFNVIQTVALAVRENGTFVPFSGDAFQYAGEMTLLGMGMIFSVLGLLWGVLALFKVIFAGKSAKAPKVKAEKSAPAPAPVAEEPVAAPEVAAADDTALIAVLTAAIAESPSVETNAVSARL